MDKEFLALEAARLSKDPVFLEVLDRIRKSAVEGLVTAKPDDIVSISKFQAYVKICDLFPAEMAAMIQSSQPAKPKTVI